MYFREQDLMMEEYGSIWDPENFTFTYKMNGETYELYDEQQILYPSSAPLSSLFLPHAGEEGLHATVV